MPLGIVGRLRFERKSFSPERGLKVKQLRYLPRQNEAVQLDDGTIEVTLGLDPEVVVNERLYEIERCRGRINRRKRAEILAKFCDDFHIEAAIVEMMLKDEIRREIDAGGALVVTIDDLTEFLSEFDE